MILQRRRRQRLLNAAAALAVVGALGFVGAEPASAQQQQPPAPPAGGATGGATVLTGAAGGAGVATAAGAAGAAAAARAAPPPLQPAPVEAQPAPLPAPTPKRTGPSARERFVRDSLGRAAILRDSLARAKFLGDSLVRAAFLRDSLARAQVLRDSLARAAIRRDSLAREAVVHDSLTRAIFVHDSLARAAFVRDSMAALAAADSAAALEGSMPRIQGDQYITRPTFGVEVDYYRQVKDNYWQLQLSYARPFAKRRASWEIDLPFQYWMSVPPGATVTGVANMSFIVNRVISSSNSKWRQIASVTLNPQAGFINDTLGNNQWIIQPQYAISRWFLNDRLQARSLTYWQYGFNVDSGTTKKNILVPRLVVNGVVTQRFNAGLDYRPRFDFTRNEFYQTLQLFSTYALTDALGLQAGYEWPLDSLARKRVEISKAYVIFSKTW